MLSNLVIKDSFGQHYKIFTNRERPTVAALEAERFHSSDQALRIISNLVAPVGYWQKIFNSEATVHHTSVNDAQAQNEVAKLLFRNKIKLFKITLGIHTSNSEKTTLQDNNQNKLTFMPVSSLLVNTPKEVKTFDSTDGAAQYIAELNPDIDQLQKLSRQLELGDTTQANTNKEGIIKNISEALAAGSIVIGIDQLSSPSTPEKLMDAVASDKPVDLPSTNAETISTDDVDASGIDQKSQATTLAKASEEGTPFCEECEKESTS